MSFILTTYQLEDFDGALKTYHSPIGYRYLRIPKPPFWAFSAGLPGGGAGPIPGIGGASEGWKGSFKTAMVVDPVPPRASVILFKAEFGPAPFQGEFQAYSAIGGEPPLNVAQLPFTTGSALVVRHGSYDFMPLMLKSRFKERATQLLEEAIASVEEERGDFVDRRGDLSFGWEPFPDYAPDQVFIRISIPLKAKLPVAPDLDCRITYLITLDIAADGTLSAFVEWVQTWVDGGLFSNSVSWRLKAAALDAVGTLNAELAAGLTDLNSHRWSDWYLMPGTFPTGGAPYYPKDYKGNSWNDVTVVLVRA